jgi:hypothetical protein
MIPGFSRPRRPSWLRIWSTTVVLALPVSNTVHLLTTKLPTPRDRRSTRSPPH